MAESSQQARQALLADETGTSRVTWEEDEERTRLTVTISPLQDLQWNWKGIFLEFFFSVALPALVVGLLFVLFFWILNLMAQRRNVVGFTLITAFGTIFFFVGIVLPINSLADLFDNFRRQAMRSQYYQKLTITATVYELRQTLDGTFREIQGYYGRSSTRPVQELHYARPRPDHGMWKLFNSTWASTVVLLGTEQSEPRNKVLQSLHRAVHSRLSISTENGVAYLLMQPWYAKKSVQDQRDIDKLVVVVNRFLQKRLGRI